MSGDDKLIDQDDIEQLLKNNAAKAGSAKPSSTPKATGGDQTLDQSDIEAMLSGKAATAAPVAAPDDDKLLGQDDIEKLLNKAGKTTATGQSAATAVQPAQAQPSIGPGPARGRETVQQGDIEYLLNQAQAAIDSITVGPSEPNPYGVSQFKLEKFVGMPASTETATLDLIRDVDLDLKIELGRTHMYLEDVLKLSRGSVVPLDKMAGDPVDIFVNGRLIARGEVLVMNDNFCVRVAELIAGEAAG
jgi:flagellar motor switch protein FliN/FliY